MLGLRSIWIGLLLAACTASSAFSQAVNATIVGTVSDVGGGMVPKAKVIITETNTGIAHAGLTNESGNFTFPDLPPGVYSVTVEQPGFKKETKSGVNVSVNSTARVDVQLTPGSVSETVEVSATSAVLQTERADTGRTMEAIMMEELPLGVNRNIQTLLELVPGTTESTFQHSQFFNASSSLQTNVNGQARMGNNYQIEGIDNNERTGLLQILIPPAESIQQVSVSTTNHDPELGRASGAVSNWILKSGTNAYHGQAYYLTQNSKLDARSFFNPSVGHLVYNRVGGNFGGPIKKNKLFFFSDYLATRDHEANTNQTTIPSMAYRTGDLSADLRTVSDNGKAHTPHVVYDPTTGAQDGTGANRTPFPGNIIPTNRLNPAALKILGFLPAPNEPFDETLLGNNYFALLPMIKTNDQVDSKIDVNLSDKDRLSGRFSFGKPRSFQAPEFGNAGGPAQGAFEGSGVQKTYSTGINYNRTISPTLLTEVRVGVAHYHNEAQQSDYGINDTTNLGITGINVNPFTSGMLGISIPNFSSPLVGYSASLPWVRAEANIDLVNSWTWIKKNHTIKFGGDLRRLRDDLLQDQTFGPRGVFTFGANQTWTSNPPSGTSNGLANDMASFLLGLPSSVGRDVNTYFPALRAWQVFLFAADNWQVTPKLTVNLGVRWEIYPSPTPAFPGGFSNYDFNKNELVIAGVGGNPMNLGMITKLRYVAPRVGLAYRLTQNTVIRAGFGMSYAPYPDNTYAYNYPVRSNNTYNTTGASTYGPAFFPAANGQPATPITFGAGLPVIPNVPVPANGIITNPDPSVQYFVVPTDFHNPGVITWNFAIQRSLPWHFVLDTAYVGNHGVDTSAMWNLNNGFLLGQGNFGRPQFVSLGKTASVQQNFRGFSSSYNSLQVKFDRRFSRGLSITTSFTWSKAMDYQGGDDGALMFSIFERRSYAKADFDRTLQYVQSYIYRLPFGKGQSLLQTGVAGKILGGWQITGITSLRTGRPFSVTCSCGNLNTPALSQTANQVVGDVGKPMGINAGNPWFDTSAYATVTSVPVGTMGNSGRNEMVGPGMVWINANLARTFRITERWKLDFRAESLNILNKAWFSNPQNSFTSSTFGDVTGTVSSGTGVNGTGGGRVVQFGGRLTF
jgi:hypothetical protein